MHTFLLPYLLTLIILTLMRGAKSSADPHMISVTPNYGPDDGGYRVVIRGRNLAFLADDFQRTFVGGTKCLKPQVLSPFETYSVEIPPCKLCGLTKLNAIIYGKRSNFLNFTFTNDCFGPRMDGEISIIPPLFSARENCTICTNVVHLALSILPDNFRFQAVVESLRWVCRSTQIMNFTMPKHLHCNIDYSIACLILVRSRGDTLADIMWKLWDEHYFNGTIPYMACKEIDRCE